MANDGGGSSFVSGFLLGGIVGAVVGILMAPKSGVETRADLISHSDTLRTRAGDIAGNLRENVGPAVEVVRERVGPVVEEMVEKVGPVAEKVATHISKASDSGPEVELVKDKLDTEKS